MVPARYIGSNKIHRHRLQGPGYNADGTRRESPEVQYGDVLLMPAREILGQTLLFDPRGVNGPLDLGPGRRVMPEHAELSDDELALLGYEFHGGRSDFALVVQEAAPSAEEVTGEAAPTKKGAK